PFIEKGGHTRKTYETSTYNIYKKTPSINRLYSPHENSHSPKSTTHPTHETRSPSTPLPSLSNRLTKSWLRRERDKRWRRTCFQKQRRWRNVGRVGVVEAEEADLGKSLATVAFWLLELVARFGLKCRLAKRNVFGQLFRWLKMFRRRQQRHFLLLCFRFGFFV
ncbi:hypothetical protein BCR33DRAFT_815609, partial [Rhizoclosmatium globosum]